MFHGFLRSARGAYVTFDVRGAGSGPWQGTLPLNINAEGKITGWYLDGNGTCHGFLRIATRKFGLSTLTASGLAAMPVGSPHEGHSTESEHK